MDALSKISCEDYRNVSALSRTGKLSSHSYSLVVDPSKDIQEASDQLDDRMHTACPAQLHLCTSVMHQTASRRKKPFDISAFRKAKKYSLSSLSSQSFAT